MPTTKDRLDLTLKDVQELEDFFYALLPGLDEKTLGQGDDVLSYAKKLKLKIPESLRGHAITWETNHSHAQGSRRGESITLVRPGHSDVIGLVIKCVKVRKWRVCLECSWIWCRIVISGRF